MGILLTTGWQSIRGSFGRYLATLRNFRWLPVKVIDSVPAQSIFILFPKMKTTLANPNTEKKWYLVDAENQTLGRLSVKIANILRGKHKPTYTPHIDAGDFVIVVNAAKVRVTGRKEEQKEYMSYSGWMGGEKYRKLSDLRETKPEFIIEHAVKGMLPRNKLANAMIKKLKIYGGAEHPHQAQNPEAIQL